MQEEWKGCMAFMKSKACALEEKRGLEIEENIGKNKNRYHQYLFGVKVHHQNCPNGRKGKKIEGT